MKTKLLFTMLLLGSLAGASAQGLKLGDNPGTIDPASLLEMESRNQVFVPPRVTTGQMNAITPLEGGIVYNTDEESLFYYENGIWNPVGGVKNSGENLFAGSEAGDSNTSGIRNVALGFSSFRSNSTGNYNTATGSFSLDSNVGSSNNSAFGYNALRESRANNNSAFGFNSLRRNVSGVNNSAFGVNALRDLVNGDNNSAVGMNALRSTDGFRNTAVGEQALQWQTTGDNNVAIGFRAGRLQANGSNLTEVSNSIFIGESTSSSANGQSNEIVIGHNAIGNGTNTVTIGADNIEETYLHGTVFVDGEPISGGGGSDPNVGTNNVFVGNGAGENTALDPSGRENVAVGVSALGSNVTGIRNTAIGTEALFSNVSGVNNTAMGNSALINNIGNGNSGFGFGALASNTDGASNSALGTSALTSLNTGSDNIAFGRTAGNLIANGSQNTNSDRSVFLGSNTRANANGENNQIVIGHGAVGNGSLTVTIGNDAITDVYFGNGYIFSGDAAPASSSAPGETGEIRIDANFIYVCVAPNSWVRAALSSW
ncbi:hypothetical protein [Robiginitalea aurantiaca]|uniref:Trimeric autotransporter adhesin YadA-like head domain-containing protein n=1 Tax=Robiginitalea aurantiaca TaxID=3056915 RepID=A0ABT7WIQ1_9FLAO|nr:hypothetical protein [Robiginitalea aurantiaca]MDM9632738.1 hypothetical protein [Robiginitalea aurantiaca]